MKTWQKVTIGVGGVVVLGGIVLFSINQANKGVTTVQTAKVSPQDALISQVTASGEIKPTSSPPRNQTGMVTSMPLPPSKSNTVPTMGSPMTSAAVNTPFTIRQIRLQVALTPSC